MSKTKATRVYLVTSTVQKDGAPVSEARLVDAGNRTAAVRHVIKGRVECEVATQADLIRLTKAGIEVEIGEAVPNEPEIL